MLKGVLVMVRWLNICTMMVQLTCLGAAWGGQFIPTLRLV